MKLPFPIERPNQSTPGVMADAIDITDGNGNTRTLATVLSEKVYTQTQWEDEPNKETVLAQYTNVIITED